MEQLFVKGIRLNRNSVEDFDKYPFNIPIIKNLTEIQFEKPVTFIMGENGSGKSTIIESLAISLGLSAEGGTRNMVYETYNCIFDYSFLGYYCSTKSPQGTYKNSLSALKLFSFMPCSDAATPSISPKGCHLPQRGRHGKITLFGLSFGSTTLPSGSFLACHLPLHRGG